MPSTRLRPRARRTLLGCALAALVLLSAAPAATARPAGATDGLAVASARSVGTAVTNGAVLGNLLAAAARVLPQADGQTLPCANTSLSCVTLRYDNPDTNYLATKHWLFRYLPATRPPSTMRSVPEQFAWRIDTSPINASVMIREGSGAGRCLQFARTTLVLGDCDWTPDVLWTFRPVDGTDTYQIVQQNGFCLGSQGGSAWMAIAEPCVSPRAAQENWQVFTYQGRQKALFGELALKSAFSSCFDAQQKDTGRCEFATDPTAAAPVPVVHESCARVPGGRFPLTNNSDTPQEFTLSTERSNTTGSTWKDTFKGSTSLDGLLGKVLKVSAEYTKEWGGSVTDSTKETESHKLVVGPHRKAWVFYRDVYLPVKGTWTFGKGTGHEWTYNQTPEIGVVGTGSKIRERVDNFVPTSEVTTASWSCLTRGAPEIAGAAIPAVDTGSQSTAPTAGQTISVGTGTWNESGDGWTYGYQWQRAGQPISGATSATYTVQGADVGAVLSVRVSAAHRGYITGYADSTKTAPVVPAAPVPGPSPSAPSTPAPSTPSVTSSSPVESTVAPIGPAPVSAAPVRTTATIKAASTDPSTADDPLPLVVKLLTRPLPGFAGEAVLLDGDREIGRHAVSAPGTIVTDSFTLPADLEPGQHTITVRFLPRDPGIFLGSEASVAITAA